MRENSISLPLPLLVGKQTSVDLKIPHLDLNTEWLEHVLISLRRVEADVKLLRAAEKVWPEEIRCGRKFVEDQSKNEEMTSCPQCNCANIKRVIVIVIRRFDGQRSLCNLQLESAARRSCSLEGKTAVSWSKFWFSCWIRRPRSPKCDLFRLEPQFIRDVLHPKLSLSPNLTKPDRSKCDGLNIRKSSDVNHTIYPGTCWDLTWDPNRVGDTRVEVGRKNSAKNCSSLEHGYYTCTKCNNISCTQKQSNFWKDRFENKCLSSCELASKQNNLHTHATILYMWQESETLGLQISVVYSDSNLGWSSFRNKLFEDVYHFWNKYCAMHAKTGGVTNTARTRRRQPDIEKERRRQSDVLPSHKRTQWAW